MRYLRPCFLLRIPEVEEGQAQGAFQFVDPVAGQEDDRDMGLDALDVIDAKGLGPRQEIDDRLLACGHAPGH